MTQGLVDKISASEPLGRLYCVQVLRQSLKQWGEDPRSVERIMASMGSDQQHERLLQGGPSAVLCSDLSTTLRVGA